MTRNTLPGFAALITSENDARHSGADLGRMAQHFERLDHPPRNSRKRAVLFVALIALALFAGWFATKAIANAAHAVVHAHEMTP